MKRSMASLAALVFAGALACEKKGDKPHDQTGTQPSGATAGSGAAGASGAAAPVEGDIPAPPDVKAPPADAQKTASGLASKVLTPGTGKDHPQMQDTVKVHYTGWTTDGKMFDSSVKRGQPTTFPLKGVIPGWSEGVQLMVTGEKRRLWIPEELAYKGRPGAPQGMLVFDIELLELMPGPKPIPAPEDVKAPPADATKLPSGLAFKTLQKGTGNKKPDAWDRVKVHYTGWTTDGNMFDSSVQRGQPAEFPLDRVIPGWSEAVQQMVIGEKARFWIPEELAYKGRPGAPQGMLVFEIELLEVTPGPKPIAAPKDVKAPPKDAKKTPSGIAYKVLKKGNGKEHPKATSTVEVHYTGWQTDGKMFDSSVQRGQPATFPLNGVIKGWTEGVQLMTPGEKTIFWIPENLAYGDSPGGPKGMLVFEIELLKITNP